MTGPGKGVHKRGSGLGTGPVGEAGGYAERKEQRQSAGARSGGSLGGSKLIALLLALLLGGGGGQPSAGTQQSQGGQGSGWASLLGGLNAGSTSSGWKLQPNTGRLDTTVAPEARDKYTKLLGNGKDTVTIMVYMCGTDLESRAGMGTSDLQEMLGAKFGDNINLLVYTGGCKGWKNSAVSSAVNQIWQVKDGKLVCLQKDLGAVSMTDPGILAGYIQWCAKSYPASRYELILWDHGGGSVSGYGGDRPHPVPVRRLPHRLGGDRARRGLVLHRLAHRPRVQHLHAHHRGGTADRGHLCGHLRPEVPGPADHPVGH